jgi:glycosyltransferase involved in cell wall biosynthesis
MLCYYFPPIMTAGTQRSVGFATWLRESKWRPIVLTVAKSRNRWEPAGEKPLADVDVVRSFEWDLFGVLLFLSGLFNRFCDLLRITRRPGPFFSWCLPDPQLAWLSTLRGIRLAKDCRAIYVSCSPFSSALSGCAIKIVTRKALVLDFRDAWAVNPHANRPPMQTLILGWLERLAVGICDALVLNTPGAERTYRRRYPRHAHKMTCIPNGFDRLNVPAKYQRSGRFRILHLGDFYGSRTPDRLLEALAAIGNPEIEFVQVGPTFNSYARYRDRVPMSIIDRVPHDEALALMQSASLLYLCQGWEKGISEYIAVASKTYDYLATGVPILADCPPGDNATLVSQFASCSYVVTSPDCRAMETAIRTAWDERTQVRPLVHPEFVHLFDRRVLTRRLATILDNVSGKHPLLAAEPAARSESRSLPA